MTITIWFQKFHHIIVDATGRRVLSERTAHRYRALRFGEPLPAIDLPHRTNCSMPNAATSLRTPMRLIAITGWNNSLNGPDLFLRSTDKTLSALNLELLRVSPSL